MMLVYIYTHMGNIYSHIYMVIYIGMWQIIKQNSFHGVTAPSGSPIHVIKHSSFLSFLTKNPSPSPPSLKCGSHMKPLHPLMPFQMCVFFHLHSTCLRTRQKVGFVSSLFLTVLHSQTGKPSHVNSTSRTRPLF